VVGTVPEDSMFKAYEVGDVFVFPSVKEGWGLVVLEAMASGLPVVASNIEPLIEYLRDGENSMLVPFLNNDMLVEQIIRVLLDAELRDRLIMNGRKTAEAYSWGNTALRHDEFYKGILAEK
jgi:glycosyltransferase involved in cell wall biosynthesis